MSFLTKEDVEFIRAYSNNLVSMISFFDERGYGILNLTDSIGRTILHHTIGSSGNVACVQLLLEKNADPNAVSLIDDKCSTPLHYAAKDNNLNCMTALLNHGANIDTKNSMGKRAIDLAIEFRSTECINYLQSIYNLRQRDDELNKAKALYECIKNKDFDGAKKALDSMNSANETVNEYRHDGNESLLNCACYYGDKAIVRLLIDRKASIQQDSQNSETPLYIACRYGHLDVVVLLAQEFPELLVRPCKKEQIYPLHAAIIHEKEAIVQYLLTLRYVEHGIKKIILDNTTSPKYFVHINQPMANGYTPIHLAVQSGNKKIISMLLSCKPFIKSEEEKEYPGSLILESIVDTKTPLHFALQGVQNIEVVEMLLKNGADFNASFIVGGSKYTPLQFVCKNENIEVLKLLLKYKVEDYDGASLNEAMENDRDEVVNVLLNNGVSVNIEKTVTLNDVEDSLPPVSIHWKKRFINSIEEKYILAAPLAIYCNNYDIIQNQLYCRLITEVNLSENNIDFVPFILFQLPSLKKLNLSKNELCSLQSSENESNVSSQKVLGPTLEELELQHNSLKALPKFIFQMPILQFINCSSNKLTSLPMEMWLSESLKVLLLDHNCLTQLPTLISSTHFNRNCSTEQLDNEINNRFLRHPISKKKILYSRKSNEDDGAYNIEQKLNSGLIQLDLSHNKFSEVPDGISCLAPNLFYLNLSYNEISDIRCISVFPKHLSHLALVKNNIEKINFSEKQKPSNHCPAHIESVHGTLGNICEHRQHYQLADLTHLDLLGNKLKSISLFYSFSNRKELFCENLKKLNISDTMLTKIPDGIKNLEKLEALYFTQDSYINDSFNGLIEHINELNYPCPKKVVQSIRVGCERNLNVRSLQEAEELRNKKNFPNIKLMVVGPKKVGKSLLVKSIQNKGNLIRKGSHLRHNWIKGYKLTTNTFASVGIDLSYWLYLYENKLMKYIIWECNFDKLHHVFMFQQAVYLLVWQFNDNFEIEVALLKSWLQSIQAYAPESAVIVAITNSNNEIFKPGSLEKVKYFFSNSYRSIDEMSDLPNIIDFIEVDSNKVQNIKNLCDLISKTAMNIRDKTTAICEQSFPEFNLIVEKAVYVVSQRMKSESDKKKDLSFFLNGKSFRSKMFDLIQLQNFELQYGDEELDEAVQFLHHFGSILHFNVPALNDVYFCKPQWLCDILVFMMEIIPSESVSANGLVKITDIKRILIEERFPISKGIDLLDCFDVAVKLSENDLFVPSLLPVSEINPSGMCQRDLQNEVYRRQYLFSFIPCGFWVMLIKRIRVDKNILEALSSCCGLNTRDLHSDCAANSESLNEIKIEKIINWSCWKTGIEVSCFGIRLLRISELPAKVPFYGSNSSSIVQVVSTSGSNPVNNKTAVEITVPVVHLTIGSHESQITASGVHDLKITSITYANNQVACNVLVYVVDCIDKLLSDWFPKFSANNVKRVSFCNLCIQSAVEENSQSSSFKLSFFEFEHAFDCLKKSKELICPLHENLQKMEKVFPDLCFLDFNCNIFSDNEKIELVKLIARGKFNDVFAVKIASQNSLASTAMKVPRNSIENNKSIFTETDTSISWENEVKMESSLYHHMESYMSYRTFRGELAVVLSIKHQHIVKFKGLSLKPLAMFFELAPRGSLNNYLDKYRERKIELPVYAVKETLRQVSDALNYLQSQSILCCDLKSENILVYEFPEPDQSPYAGIYLILADYGNNKRLMEHKEFNFSISRIQDGNENAKVLSFLFGSFLYELINLRRPFGNFANTNLVNKSILEGKRPKVSLVARQYPISILSLLHRCWSFNQNDRPTTLEIKGLASLEELTSLLDVLELDETFYLQCVKTCSPNNQSAVSGNSSIGSTVWCISSRKFQCPERTVVTIFSYENFEFKHKLNFAVKEKVITACLVGNTMWLGTDKSTLKVYCTSNNNLVAHGECTHHAFILCIYYCALKKLVICTQSDGCVHVYSDDIRSPSRISSLEVIAGSEHPIANTVFLRPKHYILLDSPIHCICVVESNASIEEMAPHGLYDSDTKNNPDKYELWCGQENGCISILRFSSLPLLNKKEILSAQGKKGFSDKIVTYLETVQTFKSGLQNKNLTNNSYIWMVMYPGTEVKRWNVELRIVEGVFDAKNYSEVHNVNSVNPPKKLITTDNQAQIQSLVVVEDKMYVGTSFGLFFTCNAYTMIPYTWLRCYEECISVVLPCRMISNRDVSQKENQLVITCGQKSLNGWLYNANNRDNNQSNAKQGVTLMTWNVNSLNFNQS